MILTKIYGASLASQFTYKQHCWYMHKNKHFSLEKFYLLVLPDRIYLTAQSLHGHFLSNQQQVKETELLQKGNH